MAASGEAAIAIGGEWGTLSEIGFARRLGRTVVTLRSWQSRGEGAMAEMPGIDCDLSRVQTNIAYFRLKNMHAADFLTGCSDQGLLGVEYGPDLVRFVTHHGISSADIQQALK